MSLPKNIGKKTSNILKYAGLGYQLAAVIIVSLYGGRYLDKLCKLDKPYITIVLTFVLLSGYMYKLYLELIKKKPS